MQSALEREILAFLGRIKYQVSQCDRGVIWGVLLSIFPIPPAPFIGFLISIVNIYFVRNGRLDKSMSVLVNVGLICALVNFAFLIFLYVHFFRDIRLLESGLLHDIPGIVSHLFDWLRGFVPDKPRGTVV